MPDIVLSDRLSAIASLVPKGAKAADIGTDHGYIPIWLVQNGITSSVIASDIGKKPLEHAMDSAREYGVYADIDFRLCAGLDGISQTDADTIIIAGMGGETIAAILENADWTHDGKHQMILQPMTKIAFLRSWLSENGYCFENEILVFENNDYFPIMSVRGGNPYTLTESEIYGGVLLDSDPLMLSSLDKSIGKFKRAAAGLSLSEGEDAIRRLAETKRIIAALENKKGELQNADSKRD